MTTQLNTASDVSAFALSVQEDAVFVERDTNFMRTLVTVYGDRTGINTRKNFKYSAGTAKTIGETDDLTSDAFTPSALQTLTPGEIGEQFFISDLRIETDTVENIRNDAATELGAAAAYKIETDLLGDMASFTAGTIGAAGTVITWGYVFAAATVSRAAMKNRGLPLACVLHEYQWHVLAKAVSVAGITLSTIPDRATGLGSAWYVGTAANISFYATTNLTVDGSGDAKGGLFPRAALAYDERRAIRIEPQRDASRRGWELNMSAVYAHGIWRPEYGVTMYFDAATPSS